MIADLRLIDVHFLRFLLVGISCAVRLRFNGLDLSTCALPLSRHALMPASASVSKTTTGVTRRLKTRLMSHVVLEVYANSGSKLVVDSAAPCIGNIHLKNFIEIFGRAPPSLNFCGPAHVGWIWHALT